MWLLENRTYSFWIDDPSFDTPQKRGALVTQAIQQQEVEMVKNATKGAIKAALQGQFAVASGGGGELSNFRTSDMRAVALTTKLVLSASSKFEALRQRLSKIVFYRLLKVSRLIHRFGVRFSFLIIGCWATIMLPVAWLAKRSSWLSICPD